MGYSTDLSGEMKFQTEFTIGELRSLKNILNEVDVKCPHGYVDFEINDDASGIVWNGAEKFSLPTQVLQWVLDEMRKIHPNFTFTPDSEFYCQGEEDDDRYKLRVEGGMVKRIEGRFVFDDD